MGESRILGPNQVRQLSITIRPKNWGEKGREERKEERGRDERKGEERKDEKEEDRGSVP